MPNDSTVQFLIIFWHIIAKKTYMEFLKMANLLHKHHFLIIQKKIFQEKNQTGHFSELWPKDELIFGQ